MTTFQKIILWLIPLIFAITVHEVAHGWVANYLGDSTAKLQGRLTLNPIKHMDFWGTLVIPIGLLLIGGVVFGYAKPVPVNGNNLHNPRRDMALVAAAGPLSNAIMAIIWALVAKLAIISAMLPEVTRHSLYFMGLSGMAINIAIMLLNLIPIPPLDGSRILMSFLHGRAAQRYAALERFGFIIVLVLTMGFFGRWLMPLVVGLQGILGNALGIFN